MTGTPRINAHETMENVIAQEFKTRKIITMLENNRQITIKNHFLSPSKDS